MTGTELAPEDVARAIHEIGREFMDSVAAKDAARVAALYADDARILMPGRPAITGTPEILAFWNESLGGLVDRVVLHPTHVEVSGGLAYDLGTSTITLKPANGEPHAEEGKYVTIYRRGPAGGWKIAVDSYSGNG